MHTPQLPIDDMDKRHNGLTPAIAAHLLEGARICLDRHHQSPVTVEIRGLTRTANAMVQWQVTDAVTKFAWASDTVATEVGASACVLAAVELMEGLITVRRAQIGNGADYYIAPPGTSVDDLENFIRLEVSGTDSGSAAIVFRRLNEKLSQAARGNSDLPAIAGVIGFRARLICLAQLEDS